MGKLVSRRNQLENSKIIVEGMLRIETFTGYDLEKITKSDIVFNEGDYVIHSWENCADTRHTYCKVSEEIARKIIEYDNAGYDENATEIMESEIENNS